MKKNKAKKKEMEIVWLPSTLPEAEQERRMADAFDILFEETLKRFPEAVPKIKRN